MDSMLKSSRGHCANCRDEDAVSGSNLERDEDGRWRGTCEICACPCQVTYQRGDRFKITLNLEREKRKGTTTEDKLEDSVLFFSQRYQLDSGGCNARIGYVGCFQGEAG